jgi:type I restriction enzyme S subunit
MGVPVIRLQNLTGISDYYYSRLNLPEEKYCERGDLLYMWSASFGPHIWNGDRAIYHYHIWKVVPKKDKTSRIFLYYKLAEITEEKKTRAANGGTMLHVTKKSMESTPIGLPPLPEQTAIATVLSEMNAEITALEQRLEKTRQIKQGMMQQLLTGKVRLVTPQEAEAAA